MADNEKIAHLVYWQDVVSGGMDGGVFQRDHVVCMSEEGRDREMARLLEVNTEDWRNDNPGEEWEPYTSGRTGDKEGPHADVVRVVD